MKVQKIEKDGQAQEAEKYEKMRKIWTVVEKKTRTQKC